jgi:FAD/FMN-containing dehydrogenase
MIPFNRDNPGELTRMQQFFIRASQALLDQGAFFSRPYGPWAKMAYSQDAPTVRVLKKLKAIFDPNNIMNPGKLCF